jgi:hypothetical protein
MGLNETKRYCEHLIQMMDSFYDGTVISTDQVG